MNVKELPEKNWLAWSMVRDGRVWVSGLLLQAAVDKAAASAFLSAPQCAGIGWISPQIEEQQIYH